MKTIDSWRDQLLRAVARAGLLERPRRVQLDRATLALEGTVVIEGRAVTITLVVDPLFENKLPTFRLQPWDALGFIPHVDPSGVICFLDPEGIVLDQRRQLQIVRECLAQVRRTLRDGVTGANRADFADEFEVYWQRLTPHLTAMSSLDPADAVAEVMIAACPDPLAPLRLARDPRGIMHVATATQPGGPWSAQRAIYLPLEPNTLLVPPRSNRPFWTREELRALLTHCSVANRARLASLIGRRTYDPEYIVLGLPRPAGGTALFGVRFDGVGQRHPLDESGTAQHLTPISIVRRDRSFLVQRGGGHMELGSKRVLLLGCGSVGGHLAFALAQAGVGRLALIDHDTLIPENTYRHILGKPYWGKSKALALKQAITMQLPFSQIQAIPETIAGTLDRNGLQLNQFDLVVSALGNLTSELALNTRMRSDKCSPPMVFTWLEPLGIGGHAVLTGLYGAPGCFECLYTPPAASTTEPQNRANFALNDRSYSQSLAGCTSLYTPYGALDAIRTAELAARLTIDALIGREQRNVLRSWKGDAEAFTTAGFTLGVRYRYTEDELRRQEASYPSARCPVCGVQANGSS